MAKFDWKSFVAKSAPLLGGLLGGPAGGMVGGLIAAAFGVENNDDAIMLALQTDPQAAVKLAEIESSERIRLRQLTIEAETTKLAEVNKTYRSELRSGDKFVSRMRPMFGYIVIFSIASEMIMGLWIVFFGGVSVGDVPPIGMADLVNMIEAFAIPQGIALSVLGIYIKQRSNEKAWLQGIEPRGILSSLLK